MVREPETLRRLPAPRRAHDICVHCRRPIVWVTTVAGPNGPGGKSMPVDPFEDLAGNIAVFPVSGGRLCARALTKDERVDRPIEFAGMPHFATCPKTPTGANPRLPDQVIDLMAHRAQKQTTGASR